MGIRGLESYLERYDSSACFPVYVKDVIERARDGGQNTTIVVDGMSCLRYMYGDLPWIPGGQVKEFVENVKDFVLTFISLGAEMVFYFDGPPAEVKIEEWKRRRLETIDKIERVLDKLNAGVPAPSLEGGDFQVTPPNIGTLSGVILKQAGCKVIRSVVECDEEIARYAYQNRCLAILGQDTDFVIYPGALHYWSVKHFNKHKMTTLEYSGRNLAASLRISYDQLPLLATLLGNDIVKREDLITFHKSLASNRYVPNYVNFQKSIHNVARFVKGYPSGDALNHYLPGIAQNVFRDPSKWQLLRDSVQSYNITSPPKDDLECRSGEEKWDAVLRLVKDCHVHGGTPQLYGAVVRGIYNCSNCLEDYRLHDLPPNQVILKKLRQKIYGILLFEKPKTGKNEVHAVRELAVSGRRSIDNYVSNPVIFPSVPHPGLVALWDKNDRAMDDVRWTLLCNAVNVDHEVFRNEMIPLRLAIFLLTMKYLMDEGMKLQRFELYAVISSAVLLQDYSPEMLKQLPGDVVDVRGLRLYTLICRSYGSLILLNNACGNPIPPNLASADNYQDGKLFHQTYRTAKSGSQIDQLCEHRASKHLTFSSVGALFKEEFQVFLFGRNLLMDIEGPKYPLEAFFQEGNCGFIRGFSQRVGDNLSLAFG